MNTLVDKMGRIDSCVAYGIQRQRDEKCESAREIVRELKCFLVNCRGLNSVYTSELQMSSSQLETILSGTMRTFETCTCALSSAAQGNLRPLTLGRGWRSKLLANCGPGLQAARSYSREATC